MKNSSKLINWSFWLSLIAIVISIIIVIVWIVNNFQVTTVHLDSFIGVTVALLALLVTIVLGWQIYNAVNINEKIRSIDTLESRLEYQSHELEQKYNMVCHIQAYNSAQLSIDREDYIDAYRWFQNSLQYSSLLDIPINSEIIIGKMKNCVEHINKNSSINMILWEEIESSHETIIHSPLFTSIRSYYMPIYNKLKSNVKIIES
jgi:hypothetical protein